MFLTILDQQFEKKQWFFKMTKSSNYKIELLPLIFFFSMVVIIQLKIIHLKKSMHLVSALLVGDLLQMQKLYGGTQWCQVHISGRRGPRLLSLAKGEETLCGVFLVSTLFYIPNLYIIVCTSVWVEKKKVLFQRKI